MRTIVNYKGLRRPPIRQSRMGPPLNGAVRLVREVLSTPTAPLHEQRMIALVERKVALWGYRVKRSPKGNLLVGHAQAFRRPKVIITAHMDHPGIRLLRSKGKMGEIGILGGVPLDVITGSRWRLWDEETSTCGIVGKKTHKKWMGSPVYAIRLQKPIHSGAFGQLDVPSPVWRGVLVSNRAMDNVINVATLLVLLERHRKNRHSGLLCLFTRAEEIGMVGASEVVSSQFLPKTAPIIVLEASSAKAGKVKLGGGPTLRVGDRRSCFSSDVDLWLQDAIQACGRKNPRLKSQRALMSGGTCEATLYNVHGYDVGSMILPLDHYHNRGKSRLTSERIHWEDFVALQEVLSQLLVTPFVKERLRRDAGRRFVENYQRWSSHL